MNPRNPFKGTNRYIVKRDNNWNLTFVDKRTGQILLVTYGQKDRRGRVPSRPRFPGLPDDARIRQCSCYMVGTVTIETDKGNFVYASR